MIPSTRLRITLATASAWLLLSACGCCFDSSIELREPFHLHTGENGSAFDKAAIDVGDCRKITIPDNAEVRHQGENNKLQLYMEKSLDFLGHPPEPMSIQTARKNMGTAVKRDGDALVVATFGEWDSHIEGGAAMRLVIVVPNGMKVEQKPGLSGPDSAGQEWHGKYLTKPKEVKEGYWYGPASPANGWTAIPDVPDPERRAKGN
jgi:hypothetical protein